MAVMKAIAHLNTAALAGAGFDYIALGHFHTPQNVIRDVAAYSGALEPIESNDLGAHGYIEGRIEKWKSENQICAVFYSNL